MPGGDGSIAPSVLFIFPWQILMFIPVLADLGGYTEDCKLSSVGHGF